MAQDYYGFLARTIIGARRDSAQLRTVIYQFARAQLRQELSDNDDQVSLAEAKQHIAALETAIEQIESDIKSQRRLGSTPDDNELVRGTDVNIVNVEDHSGGLPLRHEYRPEVLPPIQYPPLVPVSDGGQGLVTHQPYTSEIPTQKRPGPFRAAVWSTLQLVLAATLAVGIFSGLQDRRIRSFITRHAELTFSHFERRKSTSPAPRHTAGASRPSATTDRPSRNTPPLSPANLPMPSFFGVYAIASGRLTMLEALPIAVPNALVQISGLFSLPSAATLPDGRLKFIAFRSDLAAGAPDHTTVRVVARVMRVLTFDKSGHAKTTDVQGSWAVRGIAYTMRIAPVNGHPNMIQIESADSRFTFPSGRYALVLKNTAYDFTVAGPVTDPAHCLERTDALNEPIYNECPRP